MRDKRYENGSSAPKLMSRFFLIICLIAAPLWACCNKPSPAVEEGVSFMIKLEASESFPQMSAVISIKPQTEINGLVAPIASAFNDARAACLSEMDNDEGQIPEMALKFTLSSKRLKPRENLEGFEKCFAEAVSKNVLQTAPEGDFEINILATP